MAKIASAADIAAADAAREAETARLAKKYVNRQSAPAVDEKHPVQPLIEDHLGVVRFKRNAIVDHLATPLMNELAGMPFAIEDREQLAQLIGYSLDGFGTLSYVTDETYERAAAQAEPVDQRERFEQACYAHYLARHAAGKTPDSNEPAGTREQLLWRQGNGEYGVLMFNASWWAWQEALK